MLLSLQICASPLLLVWSVCILSSNSHYLFILVSLNFSFLIVTFFCVLIIKDTRWVLEKCPGSLSTDCTNKLIKESFKPAQEDNSCSGRSTVTLMSNKFVQVPRNHSVERGRDVKDKEYEMVRSGVDGCNGKPNVNSPPVSSQIRARAPQECGTVQIDMNQVEQLSPGSPPSFGDIKESENDSNDQGGDDVRIELLLSTMAL